VDERDVVDAPRQVGEHAAHPRAALAVLRERERRLHQREAGVGAGDGFHLRPVAGVERLAVQRLELRPVEERVHLRHAAVHEELDDALGLGGVVQAAGLRHGARPRAAAGGEEVVGAEQVRHRDPAEPATEPPEELAARGFAARRRQCYGAGAGLAHRGISLWPQMNTDGTDQRRNVDWAL
jgi:hypothetical protein